MLRCERAARSEYGAGVRVQRVQISRYEPNVVEDRARLVKRPVGPEGECCANDTCVSDESSHTGGSVNGVDGVSKIVFIEACAVERVGTRSEGQVCDRYGLTVRRDGHSLADLRSRAWVYADEFAEAACTQRAADGCAVERAGDVEHEAGQTGHGVRMAHEHAGPCVLVNGNQS